MTAPSPSSNDLVGQVIGKYEIVRLIGAGGMGRVYEGLNTDIGKRVALKFIEREAATTDAVARFQREARTASAVESAHIVEIFDSGVTDQGMPFIVMELLRGEDLGHRIRRLGRLELPEALTVTAQILRGLHRAHEAGIVHRDLKPDNIFLVDRDDEQVFSKIVDFGVSKITRRGEDHPVTITQEGTVLGTPVYMSPEQAQAQTDVDGRADVYSVGAILYECLSGRPPHSGQSYEQVIVNICMKDADDIRLHNPVVPEGIARILGQALARDRDQRFQSARDFLDALVPESGGVVPARSVSTPDARKMGTPTPSQPVAPGPATLGAVSTVAALPSSMPPGSRSTRERSSSANVYVGVAVGAVLLGAVLVVGFTLSRSSNVPPQSGLVSSASLASTAPAAGDSTDPVLASTSKTQPTASVSKAEVPSAVPAHSAVSEASSAIVTPRRAPVPNVPVKGGVGGELKLQTH